MHVMRVGVVAAAMCVSVAATQSTAQQPSSSTDLTRCASAVARRLQVQASDVRGERRTSADAKAPTLYVDWRYDASAGSNSGSCTIDRKSGQVISVETTTQSQGGEVSTHVADLAENACTNEAKRRMHASAKEVTSVMQPGSDERAYYFFTWLYRGRGASASGWCRVDPQSSRILAFEPSVVDTAAVSKNTAKNTGKSTTKNATKSTTKSTDKAAAKSGKAAG